MANWNEIPRDIWRLILQKVVTVITDHIPFCGVCRLWRSIGLEYRRSKFPANVPGLMIPGGPTTATRTRRFLAFPVGKDITQLDDHDLPVLSVPQESLCRGSHRGWLVIVEKNMTMYIYNPISGVRISLPPVTTLPKLKRRNTRMSKWYVKKAILSAIPLSSSSVNCFVLVFYGFYEMAYCKVGDVVWTAIEGPKRWRYIDAIFYKEVFYIMDYYGGICILDVNLPHPKVTELGISPPRLLPYVQKWYLVEFGGELLQILREILIYFAESDKEDTDEGQQNNANEDDEFDYDHNFDRNTGDIIDQTTDFQVFKLDMSSGLEPKWIDVKDLEGGAVFVGLNQSFALTKSNLVGYKGDRIYYTDDNIGSHKLYIRSGNDIGVFNIADSIVEPLYSTHSGSTKPPAVWITPMEY
ncbi:putative F-box protein At5g55150 [Rhododendron vialii]|uniref:putative F-box protein At5g55150 n=1 Tax=Rhododendron vialii TaxID=182163 RepID=UPI00265E19BC|nr:putative F-box protein At5g55150 [Rhododendron vialii]